MNKTVFTSSVIIASIFCFSNSATAQDEDINYTTSKECRQIKRNSTRLACYDTVTDGLTFTVEVKEKVEREAFGASALKATKKETKIHSSDSTDEEPSIIVNIASVTKKKTGKHTFTTTEGHVWRQVSADYVAKEKTPYEAVIKKGRFGSYDLISLNRPKRIKVKRIK